MDTLTEADDRGKGKRSRVGIVRTNPEATIDDMEVTASNMEVGDGQESKTPGSDTPGRVMADEELASQSDEEWDAMAIPDHFADGEINIESPTQLATPDQSEEMREHRRKCSMRLQEQLHTLETFTTVAPWIVVGVVASMGADDIYHLVSKICAMGYPIDVGEYMNKVYADLSACVTVGKYFVYTSDHKISMMLFIPLSGPRVFTLFPDGDSLPIWKQVDINVNGIMNHLRIHPTEDQSLRKYLICTYAGLSGRELALDQFIHMHLFLKHRLPPSWYKLVQLTFMTKTIRKRMVMVAELNISSAKTISERLISTICAKLKVNCWCDVEGYTIAKQGPYALVVLSTNKAVSVKAQQLRCPDKPMLLLRRYKCEPKDTKFRTFLDWLMLTFPTRTVASIHVVVDKDWRPFPRQEDTVSMVYGFTIIGEQFTETDFILIQYKATVILDTNGVQVIIPGLGGRIHPSERVIELDQAQTPHRKGAGPRGNNRPNVSMTTTQVWPLRTEMQHPPTLPQSKQGQLQRTVEYQTPNEVGNPRRSLWTASRSDYPPIQTTMLRPQYGSVSTTEQEIATLKTEMKRRDEREQAMEQHMTRLNQQVCDLEKNVVSKSDLTTIMLEERQATHTLITDATDEHKSALNELRALMVALTEKLNGK